jgi:predicted nucleotidyltransferase
MPALTEKSTTEGRPIKNKRGQRVGKGFLNNGTKMLHMEQNLSNDIVAALLGQESHARALAKRLSTNHMTVARKLKELVNENVLDFRIAGKNKVYFLKKTSEARNYALMSELHRLNQTLKQYPRLRNLVDHIQKDPRVNLAVLFGSHAKGTAEEGSDIDVFIETDDRSLKRELELLDSKLSVKIGPYDESNLLMKEIEKNHVILKGVELYYERLGLFR